MRDVVMASASDNGGEKLSYNPFYNIENSELLGYEYAWVNYIKNNVIPEGIIPKEILESWSRCRALGLGALAGSIDPHMISDEELAGRTEENSDFLNAARHVTQEKHKPYEVIRTIEFFELVLDALVNVSKAEKGS